MQTVDDKEIIDMAVDMLNLLYDNIGKAAAAKDLGDAGRYRLEVKIIKRHEKLLERIVDEMLEDTRR